MKKYLLVEGITDVAIVEYICLYQGITKKFNDFVRNKNYYNFNDLTIVNLKGQNNLKYQLSFLEKEEIEISKIGILQDADKNFKQSEDEITKEIDNSQINSSKISYFLTPNHRDLGNLETLLLSSLDKETIPQLQCFEEYKKCLNRDIYNIEKRAIDKHEVEAYIKFSEKPRNRNQAQFSFVDEKGDTGLWDLSKEEFQPIIKFVESIFK